MLTDGYDQLQAAKALCCQSRISGAVGNYGGNMTPEIEREALRILGLEPYYGATQIVPRTVHAPLAQALLVVAEAVGKIALDVRLMARSGTPLVHEPFSKIQKGSSAMPHKKNTIITEQMEGMVRLARGYVLALTSNISTWEERAIEQSCVERVAWPDLFHVVSRIVTQMTKVCSGLVVYPDRMLQEVIEARGTYATDEAKNFLAKELGKRGVSSETAYRIVQLASFCVFEPSARWLKVRDDRKASFKMADSIVENRLSKRGTDDSTIGDVIENAALVPVPSLAADEKQVAEWNALLRDVFSTQAMRDTWQDLFLPSHLLQGEAFLFDKILGE
jgi:adenylosuccinate lyase